MERAFSLEDEYSVQAVLGQGGFSVVKEVYLRATAVKITSLATLRNMFNCDNDRLIRRWREALVYNRNFKSKHLIRFLDFRISSEDYFGFWEVCRGGDLFTRVTEHPSGLGHMPEETARKITYNLIEALAEFHRDGYIHRDVKPDNVLYRSPDAPDEDVVLSDFGCSLDGVEPGQLFVGVAGSPGYIAPEMAAGLPYNHQVDVFALGVTAYEMLTGRSPFIAEDAEAVLKEVVERDVAYPAKYWRNVSIEALDAVQCMLRKDPLERWTMAELVKHPWFTNLTPTPGITINSQLPSQTDERVHTSLQRIRTAASSLSSASSGSSEERKFPLPPIAKSILRKATAINNPRSREEGIFDTEDLLAGLPMSQVMSRRFSRLDT